MNDPKARLNHRRYLEALSRMTFEQRLLKAIELGEIGRQALRDGIRQARPDANESEQHRLYLEVMRRCHNSDY